jgi:uncharacterized protein (TIGR02186 family)
LRPLAILVGALAILSAGEAAAERMTISLSTDEIRIDSTFTGDTVTLFGVIERDASTVSRGTGYQIAVVLSGPPETVVERRKDQIALVWINSASETITAPSFYALNTSGELSAVSTVPLLSRYQIGFDNIKFVYQNRPIANDPAATEFRNAFIRLKQDTSLYMEEPDGVSFIGGNGSVFQSSLWIPANTPVGRYTANVFLFSGNALLARETGSLDITRVGFEQLMFAAAHEHALTYGLACVALALFTGWLAGVVFRRD